MNINLTHVACILVGNLELFWMRIEIHSIPFNKGPNVKIIDIYICLVDRSTKNENKHKKMNDETA